MLDPNLLSTEQLAAMAHAAAQQTDHTGAASLWRIIAKREPRNADALASLGSALLAIGEREESLAMYRRAVTCRPKDWRLQAALASALQQNGLLDQSCRTLANAIRIAPPDPKLFAEYAHSLERVRRAPEARAAVVRALELDPTLAQAALMLGKLETDQGNYAEAEKWLRQAAQTGETPHMVSGAWHALGSLCEAQKRWDEAWEFHTRGNRAKLATGEARLNLSKEAINRGPYFLSEGCGAFYRKWAERRYDDGVRTPVFLVGFPRSGTTMTEHVLGAIPGAVTTDEQPVLAASMEMAERMAGDCAPEEFLARLDALPPDQITKLRKEYWVSAARLVGPRAASASLLVDKAPFRFIDVGLVNLLFPDSRIIFVVRDPRDCCVSCYFQDFGMNPFMARFLDIATTGDMYAEALTFWNRIKREIAVPWMEVGYEAMVADFEPHARRLVEFIGREWSDEVLRFHEKASGKSIRTPSYRAVTEKVNTRAVGKWARYEKHLGPLVERVRPFLIEFGYQE